MGDVEDQVERDRGVISSEGERLIALAGEHWSTPVQTCPGWEVSTALAHVAVVHRWATANLTAGERVRLSTMPRPPEGRDEALAWYREGLVGLLDAVARTDPLAPAWTFATPATQPAWWWARRQAQETGVHRWDAEHAVATKEGRPDVQGFEPAVAAAGIEEYFAVYLPRVPAERRAELRGTLHIHTTDTPGEWVVDLDDPAAPPRREHAKADTAVRGPASDVLLWLWNRRPPTAPLEVLGHTSVATGWTQIAI
jgi:uncharacterized protein (TIGR03083 family)